MKRYQKAFIAALIIMIPSLAHARGNKDLTITTQIDSVYVFGFDLRESRSAKGGIWNLKTGKPETPLNYSKAKKDTLNGQAVVKLYREVALGNHPLNGWETWVYEKGGWVRTDSLARHSSCQQPECR